MVREARRPSQIQIGERPYLQSEHKGRAGDLVCFCQEMGMCPLRASAHTRESYADSVSYACSQVYPSDNGWWLLRDIVDDLRALSTTPDTINTANTRNIEPSTFV